MADIGVEDDSENSVRPSRPSLAQVRAVIGFIQKHPDLAHRKLQSGVGARQKIKKLWAELTNIANSLDGSLKTTKGWIKFWSDKRRSVMFKHKLIEEGKIQDTLSPTEQQIYDLCSDVAQPRKYTRRNKNVKVEISNGDEDGSIEDLMPNHEDLDISMMGSDRMMSTEAEDKQFAVMERLLDVMDQQSQGIVQMAQAVHSNAKALERLAEASHIQALAVDRIASTFENITSSVHEVRNAIISIDYTLKRCYPTSVTEQRQNSNLFG